MSAPVTAPSLRLLSGDGPALAIRPRPQRGLGAIILRPDSPDLIAGVMIETGALWPDDRGFFTELFRFGVPGVEAPFTSGFSPSAQISVAASFPGVIKAMHYHRLQTDLWAPVRGQLQVALYDLRCKSATFGGVNTLYLGEWRPWRLRIPPGVGHGYKVVGAEPALMVYATDRFYNPDDEGRIPYDDPDLNYDWELQHK